MKIYQYKNYQEYKKIQTEANVKKLDNVWINEQTLKKIKSHKKNAENILCHGVRNTKELIYFEKYYPSAKILGTEISHTANKFKNVVEWDFHNVNNKWINHFDIVYSNSWDHSYDPIKSLNTWKDQLSENGYMFLEHGFGEKENKSKSTDPLEIYDSEIIKIINDSNCKLKAKFQTTALKNNTPAMVYVIIKNT